MIDDVLDPLKLEKTNYRLLPKCNWNKTVTNTRLIEVDWSSFQQWNPRGKDLKFNYYCWSGLLIFHGLLNFVFDRGKSWCGEKIWQQEMHTSAFRTRLFF